METPSKQAAFAELANIYNDVADYIDSKKLSCNMRGICCDFEKVDHRLYATKLEIDYLIHCSGDFKGVQPKKCPWFMDGKCEARQGRVLGCRAYFCTNTDASSELYEEFFNKIKTLHNKWNIDYAYVAVFAYLTEMEIKGDN